MHNQGTMNCGSQPIDMGMIEKGPTLAVHRKLIDIGTSSLNRALCDVGRPICVVRVVLPDTVPEKTIANQPLAQLIRLFINFTYLVKVSCLNMYPSTDENSQIKRENTALETYQCIVTG
jgi:hypothetical protein